ncbi:N-acetylmuramoyl-L-alanine amidase family protein [Silvibacterium sp.]|uniref:N-acetylmuramoyl-L-alanine amidase family protein n=1 Tax=Silvibacterium sp. TaxID=1964179 RepID=UPI0039E53954
MRWTSPLLTLVLPAFAAAPAFAQTPQQSAPQQVTVQTATPAPSIPAALPTPVTPRFVVVLDAAHGGSDTGARISSTLLEKSVTLNFSVWLRSALAARGIGVVTTRESDSDFSSTARATAANGAQAAACLLIHATATGSGVHLYTSSLAPAQATKFLPWQTAQAAYVTQSLKLSSEIDSALAHAEVPVTLGRTSLQPMDSFACPTVALEIAPLQQGATTHYKALTDISYQKSIIDALAAALGQWKNDWRQQP